jgi:hypothetical protein
LITARDLGALAYSEFDILLDQLVEIRKMLFGLFRSLEK